MSIWHKVIDLLASLVPLIPKPGPDEPSQDESKAARHGQASGAARNYSSRKTELAEAAKRRAAKKLP